MAKRCKTVYTGGCGEITEKKSRFIATVEAVGSEAEAIAFIESMRKKYWDARHNCYAYIVEGGRLKRCSDDKEPQGTAGRPILDVLIGQGITGAAIVVTRYFGGVLLGTGGLVRAYSAAAQAGLEASVVIEKIPGTLLFVGTDYNDLGKLQYSLGQRDIPILKSEYTQQVQLELVVADDDLDAVISELTDRTNGRAQIRKGNECLFARTDDETLLFPREGVCQTG